MSEEMQDRPSWLETPSGQDLMIEDEGPAEMTDGEMEEPAEGDQVAEPEDGTSLQEQPKDEAEENQEDSEGIPPGGPVAMWTALEAILFSSNRPLKIRELQAAAEVPRHEVEQGLVELASRLSGHGIMLQRHRDHVQLVTRAHVASYVKRALHPEVVGKLSPAAYETLAIIAYEQPITRARLEEVRGVSCESVLSNLELRALVSEVGRASTPGQPKLYGTTMRFLQLVGIGSVDELPRVAEREEGTDAAHEVDRHDLPERGAGDNPAGSGEGQDQFQLSD